MSQSIIYTNQVANTLSELIMSAGADRVFALCDDVTKCLCLPLLGSTALQLSVITIPHSDAAKNTESLIHVWSELQRMGATRHSLLINIGGGMITDLGGFAAATFKRGIRFANVPTTLLSMVDAAVGGKTGINFGGFKNEVGAFCEAQDVVIDTTFLCSLDTANFRSGYAEMLKHALLSSTTMWAEHMRYPLANPDYARLQNLVQQSIEFKQSVVIQDPHEKGLRKSLNLGHTIGHAIESLYLERSSRDVIGKSSPEQPLLHGYAVAWGLVTALYISAVQLGFDTQIMQQTARFVFDHYGHPNIGCEDYDVLYGYMLHDKKNKGQQINFTLLSAPGQIHLDQQVERPVLNEALDFLRDA